MHLVAIFVAMFFSAGAFAKEVVVPKGTYVPAFRDSGESNVPIGPLRVDETPVTNREFLAFIKKNPSFSKSKIPSLFADANYLAHWEGDLTFAGDEKDFPVTRVSWFAARRYCESQGKRLPTIAEWEVLSDAQNPKLEPEILAWYANPRSKLRKVGQGAANKFGVKDAHGLIWEWVDNFAETILSGDSRGGSSTETLFCGGAGLKAKDRSLYATFMRFAFRSSLTAKYTSANLGFRCVRDERESFK